MVLAGVDFWYDNYGLWPWQAKPRQKNQTIYTYIYLLILCRMTGIFIVLPETKMSEKIIMKSVSMVIECGLVCKYLIA